MVRIERIETAGPDTKARRLVFSDTQQRLTSAAVIKELGLEEMQEVDEAALGSQLDETEATLAHERALRIVGYRERSRAEVCKRLRDDGYPALLADAIVDRFAELGLVDDARFAASWARTLVASGRGRGRILQELCRKGIQEDVANEAVDEALAGLDEVDRARAALRGRVPADRKEKDRLVRRLVTKGFSLSVALRALEPPEEL